MVIPIPESAIKKSKVSKKTSNSKNKRKTRKKTSYSNQNSPYRIYQIQSGDTYYSLAQKYGLSTADLLAFNGTKKSKLNIGDRIKIPLVKGTKKSGEKSSVSGSIFKIHKVQKGENAYRISEKLNIDYRDLIRWNDLGRTAKIYPGMRLKYKGSEHKNHNSWYIVKKGDSFWSISRKLNISMTHLKKLNPNAKLIPGMKLKVK